MYVVMCMLSKVNLKKKNISADIVIWIINKQYLEIPLTGYVLYLFSIMTSLCTDVPPPSVKIGRGDVCESPTIIVFPFPRNVGDSL